MPTARRDAKVVVIMPARNAARTLEKTINAIPRDWVDELMLVDDGSTRGLAALAGRIPQLEVVWHPHDAGYGANQKTCCLHALQRGADVVVTLRPDGRYEPLLVPRMVAPILEDRADVVLGSRFSTPGGPLPGGMPRWEHVAERALTTIANGMLGTGFSDLHTGYRAYSRRLLTTAPWLRNALDCSFDSELLLQAVHLGLRIEEVPASSIRDDDDPTVSRRRGLVHGARTLAAAATLVAHRNQWWRSRKYLP
jgi:glycosyltransferase involved in cell wall biosynthesis